MSREIIIAACATAGATVGAILWMRNGRSTADCGRSKPKKLHISYLHPELPLFIRLIAKLPLSIRKPLNIAAAAPKPPLDGVDLVGPSYNPFSEIKELVENKLWRVRYEYVRDPMLMAALKDFFGINLNDSKVILERVPAEKRFEILAMMDAWSQLENKNQGLDVKQQALNQLEAGYQDSQDMLVARLDNNGGLLLYNPCRMHPQIQTWLSELDSPVSYIVSGSSCHTNQLPQTAAAFPSARIICAEAAELKCLRVGMRRASFVYTDHSVDSDRGYQALATELNQYNVKICHLVGDVSTQSLVLVVHDHLLDTDLSCYGNGERILQVDQEDWDDCCRPSMTYPQQWFYTGIYNSSVPGYLPDYRLMSMDPSSPFCKLLLDEPDESCCINMAASLRSMLAMDFSCVDNVHSKKKEPMPAKEFRKCIKDSWRWLDEKSFVE